MPRRGPFSLQFSLAPLISIPPWRGKVRMGGRKEFWNADFGMRIGRQKSLYSTFRIKGICLVSAVMLEQNVSQIVMQCESRSLTLPTTSGGNDG
jgi:hypothetical protein